MLNVTEAVTYNRRGKLFQAELNDTKVGEADTREDAEMLVMRAANPTIARWVANVKRNDPELASRVHRAGKLGLQGHVERNGDGWLVESQTEADRFYHVQYVREGGWACECEDWLNGYRGERWGAPWRPTLGHVCKHILAVQLVEKYEEQQVTQPPAAQNGSRKNTNIADDSMEYRTVKTSGGSIDVEAGQVLRAWCKWCKRADDIPMVKRRGVVHICGNVIATQDELGFLGNIRDAATAGIRGGTGDW